MLLTYIFLVRVEKPEGEIAGLGGCSEVTQRLSVTRQQKAAAREENTRLSSGTAIQGCLNGAGPQV